MHQTNLASLYVGGCFSSESCQAGVWVPSDGVIPRHKSAASDLLCQVQVFVQKMFMFKALEKFSTGHSWHHSLSAMIFQLTNDVNINPPHRLSILQIVIHLWYPSSLLGSQCHAAAACAVCSFPCCHGDPPPELGVSCASFWPHGQEAGGAGLDGTDARNIQLYAGEEFVLGLGLG